MDAQRLNLTVAVFSYDEQLILIRLEDDDAERAVSDAACRGYKLAGSIAVNKGVPKVSIEEWFGATAAIAAAGGLFAAMLGTRLQQYQLDNLR